MTFDDVWRQVQGLPEEAKKRVPETLKEDTKKKLSRRTPQEIEKIVTEAIDEVNHGSIAPLDTLIKKRL